MSHFRCLVRATLTPPGPPRYLLPVSQLCPCLAIPEAIHTGTKEAFKKQYKSFPTCHSSLPVALISPKVKAKDLRASLRPLHYFLSSKHTLSPTPPHYPFLPSPGLLPLASLETVLVHCRAFALVVLFAWITPPQISAWLVPDLCAVLCSCHLPREDHPHPLSTIVILSLTSPKHHHQDCQAAGLFLVFSLQDPRFLKLSFKHSSLTLTSVK